MKHRPRGRGGRGRHGPRPPRPQRTIPEPNAELLGGRLDILETATAFTLSHTRSGKRQREVESLVLFGRPWAKVQQLARAHEFYLQFVNLLCLEGTDVRPDEEEDLVALLWYVLMACGTLFATQARRCVVHDPLEVLRDRLAGVPEGTCIARIVQEREARLDPRNRKKLTLFGLLQPMWGYGPGIPPRHWFDSADPKANAAPTATGPRGHASHKRYGVRGEEKVARTVGGERVPGSGSFREKGDVRVPGRRVPLEVKSTERGQRWRIPMHQVKQLHRAGQRHDEVVGVVLRSPARPDLVLRPADEDLGDRRVLRTRSVRAGARYVTFESNLYTSLFRRSGNGVVVVRFDDMGTWVLERFDPASWAEEEAA